MADPIKVSVAGVQGVKIVSTSRAQSGGSLRSLSDTNLTSLGDDYLLVYDANDQVWKSQSNLGDNTVIDGGTF